ncbi:MAG: hypothetical protein QM796_12150 [Chthoniobacteraceae bacterium]
MKPVDSDKLENSEERGMRIIQAVLDGTYDTLLDDFNQDVTFTGFSSPEAVWGYGCDLICNNVFIRVHGAPSPLKGVKIHSVSYELRVTGKLLGYHRDNKIIVVSSLPSQVEIMGTT